MLLAVNLDRAFKRYKALLATMAVLLFVLVAYVDYLTGVEIAFSIFYLLPTCLATWYLGLRAGVTASVLSALMWLVLDTDFWTRQYSYPSAPYWNGVVRLSFFLIVNTLVAKHQKSLESLNVKAAELTSAYTELDRTRKEQLVMKDSLLSHVSHELRTPLTAVHQFVTLVADGVAGQVTPGQKEYLDLAVKNIRQLNRMIGDLLDSTRSDVGKLRFDPVPTALPEVIDEIVRILRSSAAEKGIDFSVETASDLPWVLVDPARLRQVLLNLIDNALKFTPRGGSITLGAAAFDQDPAFVKVSVADTGPGIRKEEQARIFQRLHQTDEWNPASRKGLGLGLYISREIVVRHGGTIWVESEPGQGSVFSFTIPHCGQELVSVANAP